MVSIIDDRQLGFALGAADYLTKPVDRARLADILARQVPHDTRRLALVVDDLRDNRAVLRATLEREGVANFEKSFAELLDALQAKAAELSGSEPPSSR